MENKANGVVRGRGGDASDVLTYRELQVAQLTVEGCSSREVGELLGIKPATVRATLHRVYQKLDIAGSDELVELIRIDSEIPSREGRVVNTHQPVQTQRVAAVIGTALGTAVLCGILLDPVFSGIDRTWYLLRYGAAAIGVCLSAMCVARTRCRRCPRRLRRPWPFSRAVPIEGARHRCSLLMGRRLSAM